MVKPPGYGTRERPLSADGLALEWMYLQGGELTA
jgi:hypothetical protein